MRENVVGENPQLELRPAPESVGRLHERGLVDSLLFTTKPAIPGAHPRPEEARPSICLILRSAATDLGFTRDRLPIVRKSAKADLRGRASRRMRQPQDEGAVSTCPP